MAVLASDHTVGVSSLPTESTIDASPLATGLHSTIFSLRTPRYSAARDVPGCPVSIVCLRSAMSVPQIPDGPHTRLTEHEEEHPIGSLPGTLSIERSPPESANPTLSSIIGIGTSTGRFNLFELPLNMQGRDATERCSSEGGDEKQVDDTDPFLYRGDSASIQTANRITSCQIGSAPVVCLSSSATGTHVTALDAAGFASVVDVERGVVTWLGQVLDCPGTCVHVSPDDRVFAVGGRDGTVRIIDASAAAPAAAGGKELNRGAGAVHRYNSMGSTVCSLSGHDATVQSVEVLGDGVRTLSGGLDGRAVIWDARRRDALHVFEGDATLAEMGRDKACVGFTSTPAGNVGLIARWGGTIHAVGLK